MSLFFAGCSKEEPKPTAPAAKAEPAPAAAPAAATSSYDDIQPTLSSTVPTELELDPNKPVVEDNRPFFDFFSWQSFIALNWPAQTGGDQRGAPLPPNAPPTFLQANNSGTSTVSVVWDTWRTDAELFPSTGAPPPWNDPSAGRTFKRFGKSNEVAGLTAVNQDLSLSDLLEATDNPLIDQNHFYTRFGINFNEIEYSWIREKQWYIKENIPNPATLPVNSLEIKSAWRPMVTKADPNKPWQKVDDLSRYYVVDAVIPDACDPTKTTTVKMGLVGLHIIQKTKRFPEWVWSTFEQVDNVSTDAASGIRPSYNNGTDQPPAPNGYSYMPPDNPLVCNEAQRVPVQVVRLDAIPTTPAGSAKYLPDGVSTQGMNKTYQNLMKGTVWQYYQLVRTQWPSDPSSFKVGGTYPQDAGKPFPDEAANLTMETYSQKNNSCMQCHYFAAGTDFSFSLAIQPRSEAPKEKKESDKAGK
jgi:hypothetical protein